MTDQNDGSLNETIAAQFAEKEETQSVETALAEKEVKESKEAVETDEAQEKDSNFNQKFASLSRKEKEFRQEREQFKREMEEFRRMKEEFETSNKKEEKEPELPLEYRLKKNPIETLQEIGLDYETLTELALNDGKLTSDMQMKLMREEIEKEISEKYKSIEERLNEKEKAEEEAKYQQTIQGFKAEIENVVKSDLESYELIEANEAIETVYDVIETHYEETGNILEIKEAADAVEAYLYEEAQKLLKLKKLSAGKEPTGDKEPEEKRHSSTTLSNDHSAQSVNDVDKKLTNEQSIAEAAKALKWT
jgi:hypothetical protein